MAITYNVSYSTSINGPWTAFNSVATTTDNITGLSAATSYYFQVIVVDSATGLSSTPTVSGPYTTASATLESAEGTFVTTVGPTISASKTPGTVAGATVDAWAIDSTGHLTQNGIQHTADTGSVTAMYYHNHFLFQRNVNNNWWYWPGAIPWTYQPAPNAINLSNSTFTAGAGNNFVIGTISVTMDDASAFSGILLLTGADAASFKIVGNSLELAVASTNRTYNINITATQNGIPFPVFTKALPISQFVASSTIQVPLAVSLGTYLGDSGGTEGNIQNHWNDVKTMFGRTPIAYQAIGVNSYHDFPDPSWGDESGNWVSYDGAVPLLTYHFTDGATTDSDYAGTIAGNYDARITAGLARWKAKGLNRVYIRINWEFNNNFLGWGVPNSGQVSSWIGAWKRFCNVAHTWGNNNGMAVRMVWCPTTSLTLDGGNTFNLPVVNFFPTPDGAGTGTGGRYIDVIGFDYYMASWGLTNNFEQGFTTPLATNTNWSTGTFVKIAQTYNCNVGQSELGDGPSFDNNNSWSDGIMATWATYMNTLKSLTPPVPIEFLSLFDTNTGGATQFSGSNLTNMKNAWRCAMGAAPFTQPNPSIPIPSITTIPAI